MINRDKQAEYLLAALASTELKSKDVALTPNLGGPTQPVTYQVSTFTNTERELLKKALLEVLDIKTT